MKKVIQGNIYRYKEAGKLTVVKARRAHGALTEIREPKGAYKLGQTKQLTRVSNQTEYKQSFAQCD